MEAAAGAAGKVNLNDLAVTMTGNTSAGKFQKLAERVEKVLTQDALYTEYKQIDPNKILVAPLNRLGSAPNVKHVHHGVLGSFKVNSFDRTRPAPGIVVEFRTPKGIQAILEHNRRFTTGNRFLPPILEDNLAGGPVYGSLAGTHLNLALRCLKNGVQSPIGALEPLLGHAGLKEVVMSGHKWIVLPETIDKQDQMDISLWRNQDQNENHAINEIEILQTILVVCQDLADAGRDTTNPAELAMKAQARNPAKKSFGAWESLTKYFITFVKDKLVGLVQELTEFHSETVNAKELCVALRMYAYLATEKAFITCPYLRHYLIRVQYTTEKAIPSSTGPATSQFLELNQLTSFLKDPKMVQDVEQQIRDWRHKFLPILCQNMEERNAKLEMGVLVGLLLRCVFSKPWPKDMEPACGLPVGKYCLGKVHEVWGFANLKVLP